MNKEMFVHPKEQESFEEMMKVIVFNKDIEFVYINYDEKMKRPDLLGKTVKVTAKQFGYINDVVSDISKILNIEAPDVFVYEDFYYSIDSKGINKPWIEISAKTIVDFSKEELKFLIGKTLCNIALNHTKYYMIGEQLINQLNSGIFTGSKTLSETWKLTMYKWSRITHYTSDNFGYLMCKDIKASTMAIIKFILNNKFLAENLNIAEYIKQAEEINKLNDKVYNYTKLDEVIPYGPFRIKSLIAFASLRGIKGI